MTSAEEHKKLLIESGNYREDKRKYMWYDSTDYYGQITAKTVPMTKTTTATVYYDSIPIGYTVLYED